jgi:hypothetical protein
MILKITIGILFLVAINFVLLFFSSGKSDKGNYPDILE